MGDYYFIFLVSLGIFTLLGTFICAIVLLIILFFGRNKNEKHDGSVCD
jgi:hypothetical protein